MTMISGGGRFCFVACLLLLFGCAEDRQTEPDTRPNIIIVLVDELRADVLGSSGHPFFQSPCVDRIADEGVRFADAFVVTSLCSPSRATILTGLHTPQHGVRDIWTELDPSIPTIATLLQSNGYYTAFVGKSHLNDDARPLPGFDRWFSFIGQGNYIDPVINVDGVDTAMQGHITDLLTDEALRILDPGPSGRPILLILSHLAVHRPWTPQPRFDGRYAGQTLPVPGSWDDDFSDQPAFLACRQQTEFDAANTLRYFDVLAGVEESTCALLARLEELGELDDTLLIFTSDNGYMLGEHRLTDKRVAYEESIRIPLLARHPTWFEPGTVVEGNLALNLDLAPTVLEAAGMEIGASLPGLSLRALASGLVRRDRFLYLYYQDTATEQSRCTPTMAAVRTREHILIDYPSPRTLDELYELSMDPGQLHNQIATAGLAGLVDSLRVELERLRREAGDL